jgi:hypothetical protein
MAIYFAFSDESGHYKQNRNNRFNQIHPYYLRASFFFKGDEWRYFDSLFCSLKVEYEIPQTFEIKYSDLWTLQQYHNHPDRELEPRLSGLVDYRVDRLMEFIERAIALLNALNNPQIILTISKNDRFGTPNENVFYAWHIQNLMQRIQKDMDDWEEDPMENLCLIFIDPVSSKINKLLTDAYYELFVYGDRFNTFSSIKDCLHFELSYHSSGIQIADYIAGITYGYLQGRDYSIGVFNRQIGHLLRQGPNGKITGYGIVEIPRNQRVRTFLAEQFHVDEFE